MLSSRSRCGVNQGTETGPVSNSQANKPTASTPSATSSNRLRSRSLETRRINGALGWKVFDSLVQIR